MATRFKHNRMGIETNPTVYSYSTDDGYNTIELCISDIDGINLNNALIFCQATLLANTDVGTTTAGVAVRRAIYKINDVGGMSSGYPQQEPDYWASKNVAPYSLSPTQTTPFQFPQFHIKDPIPDNYYCGMFPIRQCWFDYYIEAPSYVMLRVNYSVVSDCQIAWELNLDVFKP